MNDAKLLLSEYHVDKTSSCKFRFVDSATERFPLHYHDYYEIFLTIDDNITHIVNEVHTRLKKGTLVFIRPDDKHKFEKTDKDFSFVNLSFDRETADLLFSYLSDGYDYKKLTDCKFPPQIILEEKECEKLLKRLMRLNAIKWNDSSALKMNMRIILFDIFVKYFMDYDEQPETDVPKWFAEALNEMRKKENFVEGTQKLSELCKKTPEHISRIMKKHMNITPTEFINELKMNYSVNLLINTNSSITDICYECGFGNISWFYTCFKEKYGVSPKEFKKIYNLKK